MHAVEVEPLFIETPRGRLLLTRWRPAGPVAASVLFLPPFAEELNKCRAMMALAARTLAAAGLQVLLVDLSGTGDSAGEFAEARIDTWQDDLAGVIAWADADGAPVTDVIGVRFGALLLPGLIPSLPRLRRIVLWQPVASGQLQLSQFLRLRVAASLMGGGDRDSGASLMAELRSGRTLEVAGYELSPALATGLESLDLGTLVVPEGARLHWFEVSPAADSGLSRSAIQQLERWTAGGAQAAGEICPGDTFWNTVEITTCPSLAVRTGALLVA